MLSAVSYWAAGRSTWVSGVDHPTRSDRDENKWTRGRVCRRITVTACVLSLLGGKSLVPLYSARIMYVPAGVLAGKT